MVKIDLRSDTVTKPSNAMKEFMLQSPVGDDVFEEDPTVIELEEYAAQLFGMEAGLFCSSGTMTNQIAIKAHTFPGAEVICHEYSHVYNYEGGGIASNSHASVKLLKGNRGRILASDLDNALNPDDDVHRALTALVCVEDTSNKGGGAVCDLDELSKIKAWCEQKNLPLHCDGARLFNAFVARGDSPANYGPMFNSISICLSKGLGAPVGSVLLGTKEFITKSRRIRKSFGGGMRQAGIIAGGGLFALKNNIDRLQEDHDKAKVLGDVLQSLSFVEEVLPVETNILVFKLTDNWTTKDFLNLLESKGVLAVPFGAGLIRFVTHLDFTDEQLEELIKVLKSI